MAADAAQALKARAVSLGAPPALPSFCCSDWVLFKEAKAPVFIVDVNLMPDPKRARGGIEGGGGCVTCHLRNRSTRAPLTLPIVTFH